MHEAIVNLTRAKLENNLRLGPNVHANGDGEEIIRVEQACLRDETVQAEISKLRLPQDVVLVLDPWIYGRVRHFSFHPVNLA